MIDHVSLQVMDMGASRAFYSALLAPLGISPEHTDEDAVGFFGEGPGSFWIGPAERSAERELHIAFRASTRDLFAFHQVAVDQGFEVLHQPRLFPEYDQPYFAAFVRDPDGHNIEAVCREPGA